MTLIEFRGGLWRQKTRVPGLLCGTFRIRLAVLQRRLVTDMAMDEQTDGYRAIAYRAIYLFILFIY